ncbi:MAG: lactate/malate family dehydrogenase, partial [Gammaproteobacteria bacterium]
CGAVGSACIQAVMMRNCANEIVILDKNSKRATAIATDMGYGLSLTQCNSIIDGDYTDLINADLVMITAGVNEKTGGATDRNDPNGRLRLLSTNAQVYEEIVPQIMKVAPETVILVVTDPPDPLAMITRQITGHDRVLSTGTFLDSLRFRTHVGRYFGVNPRSVNAQVLGEHGTSEVFVWSTVSIGGMPLQSLLQQHKVDIHTFQQQIEQAVRYANITIIEGNNASQYGIGMVAARIAEMVLRDEKVVIPIGSYIEKYDATLSLPSLIGRQGVIQTYEPTMSPQETAALQASADKIKQSLVGI